MSQQVGSSGDICQSTARDSVVVEIMKDWLGAMGFQNALRIQSNVSRASDRGADNRLSVELHFGSADSAHNRAN